MAALELNVSCPNVETGLLIGADPREVTKLLHRLRPLTDKPLIVKLTPNATDVPAVARAAQEAGASAVSLINTLRGMALDPASGQPWLGGTTGGVSGPAVRAIALAQVHAVAQAVEIPIVGMGGVQSGQDALELLPRRGFGRGGRNRELQGPGSGYADRTRARGTPRKPSLCRCLGGRGALIAT